MHFLFTFKIKLFKASLLFLSEFLWMNCVLFGASVMSSKLSINRMISLFSFLTGATSVLAKNLDPENIIYHIYLKTKGLTCTLLIYAQNDLTNQH